MIFLTPCSYLRAYFKLALVSFDDPHTGTDLTEMFYQALLGRSFSCIKLLNTDQHNSRILIVLILFHKEFMGENTARDV